MIEDYERTDTYNHFWVYLAYFFSFIFFIICYMNNLQNYIYYGLFFFLIGLCMFLSVKLSKILDILSEDDEIKFYEDSD